MYWAIPQISSALILTIQLLIWNTYLGIDLGFNKMLENLVNFNKIAGVSFLHTNTH